MNRRDFLASTMLTSLGLVASAESARAFEVNDCTTASTPACRELIRHRQVLAQLEIMLERQGLDETQRRAALASAVCPFCGQPLIG